MKFEVMAQELMRGFGSQHPRKTKLYDNLLKNRIPFSEYVEAWEEMANNLDFLFKLAREESV